MQSSFNILSAAYRLVNVPAVTVEVPKLFIGDPPRTSQEESINLNLLTNPNRYLQSGYVNLNVFAPKLQSGRDNIARLEQLINIIIPLVEDTEITTENGTFHFQIDDDKGIFDAKDMDGMSYYNLRLTFQTLK